MPSRQAFFDADQLRAVTFVRHVELHDSLPSTNDRALRLAAASDLEMPALVIARRQTAGRGRGQHIWWSADGALTYSLIFDTTGWGLTPRDWPRLSLATAVAVCDALNFSAMPTADRRAGSSSTPVTPRPVPPRESPKFPCSIKWPNDVLIDGRKICGILIESPAGAAPAKDRLVVGVGINVNNSWRDAPRDAGTTGTALCDVTGRRHDLQPLLVEFLDALTQRLDQLAANDSQLSQTWRQLGWLTEQEVAVDVDGRSFDGRCVGIADDGALLVKTRFTTERIYTGSVRVTP